MAAAEERLHNRRGNWRRQRADSTPDDDDDVMESILHRNRELLLNCCNIEVFDTFPWYSFIYILKLTPSALTLGSSFIGLGFQFLFAKRIGKNLLLSASMNSEVNECREDV